MRVLVTGASGFFGANLARALAGGAPLLAADLAGPDGAALAFLAGAPGPVEHARLDVCDRAAVRALVADAGVTHIVHAAAVTPDAESERAAPGRVVDINLGGTVNVLEAALAAPAVERVLLVSSSAVYGAPPEGWAGAQGEDGPLQLGSMYAAAKRAAELIAARYAASGRAEVASLRPASLYGPMERPTGSRAQMSAPWRLLDALRAGREARLFGPDVRCDWTHAWDAAEAARRLLAAPRWSHAIYNLGSGEATPLRDVAAAFEAAGLRASWVDDPAEADVALAPGQGRAPLDIGRLRDDAGYRPAYVGAAGVARWLSELGYE